MANEQDQNKQEKDWAQIIDKSRKDNANIMSLFPTAPHQQATFTERFRVQTAASGEELVTMQNQLQEVCDEWLAARAEALAAQPVVTTPVIIRAAQTRTHRHGRLRRRTFAVTPRYYAKAADGVHEVNLAYHYMTARRTHTQTALSDFRELLTNTHQLLGGIDGLTEVIDGLLAGGLTQNQRLLYEEELKSLAHRVNDLYQHINSAAFHLNGMFNKEKEVAVNLHTHSEAPADVLRHHQAVLWAYRKYLEYRASGNHTLQVAMESLQIFLQAIRKEVMRRKVESLHRNMQDITAQRREIMARQAEEAAAKAELGEEYVPEELPELPPVQALAAADQAASAEEMARRAEQIRADREA
ncbi:MAG: hypothetical protein E6Y68_04220, partial [Negativicoccus succinicivorans]|nr:hypothetical protein [Negativicoccus succinicivorans]